MVQNSKAWLMGASSWFLRGEYPVPDLFPCTDGASLTSMNVKVSHFNRIKINGDFQVQIYGSDCDSVQILGSNQSLREIAVESIGNTLIVRQIRKVSFNMREVIVRIGVKQLNQLVQMGCGSIEAIRLNCHDLSVIATRGSKGPVYVSGQRIKLRCIKHYGAGSINIFGINTPNLRIITTGPGLTNLCGSKVGVREIFHNGSGSINIIGANSTSLCIYALGCGRINVLGLVRLKNVQASEYTQVYVQTVLSNKLFVNTFQAAQVGVAGCAYDLHARAYNASAFLGRYLCTQNAYVVAKDNAHMNVTVRQRLFASVSQNASIYVFGSPNFKSPFINGDGRIIYSNAFYGRGCAMLARPWDEQWGRYYVRHLPLCPVSMPGAG